VALALYRKYRPRTFAEVIGQEHVTEPLMQALNTGRLHHAYLFSGPRGCGKTSSARILARSLNCEKGPTPQPCGACDSCQALAPDGPGSLDVIEIDAASHGGVDDARDLRERAFFAPVSSRFKVYVIDEAHMVTTQGFNALLKLVEEPPDYVKFVFATTEPEKVLGTIKSRTHHYPFRLIPPGVLRPYLEQLCASEAVSVEPAVFPLVVRAGGGSVRDSLSVLDQLISGANETGVTYARAVALLGVTDAALIDEMCDALSAGDGATALATVDRVAEAGHDPRRFAADLLERLRDLIVVQQVPDALAKGILDAPADQLERMTTQAGRFGPATLSRMADIVHNGLTEMRGTTAPRLLLELIVARMLLPGAEESTGALLQRMERMERRLSAAGEGHAMPAPPSAAAPPPVAAPPATPAPPSTPASRPAEPAPVQTAPVTAETPQEEPEVSRPAPPAASVGQLDVADLRRSWDEVLTLVGRRSKRVAALARDAVVRALDGETVTLVVKSPALATMLTDGSSAVAEGLHEVFGGTWQVRCDVGGADQGTLDPSRTESRPTRPQPAPQQARPAPPEQYSGGGGDWPTPARLGGDAAPEPVEQADPPATASAARATPGSGRTKAKAPARTRGTTRTAAKTAPETAPPAHDPFEGFDEGDEPLDDDESGGPRQSSEEQALQLLAEQLGAEKIGEVEHR
jgi:DNA polymerase-3 subunit gamma/tau